MQVSEFLCGYINKKYSRKYSRILSIEQLVHFHDMSLARTRFIQTFNFTKNELCELKAELQKLVSELEEQYSTTIESEAMRVWGRPWTVSDYKISAICSYDFSDSVKDLLRQNRHDYHVYFSAIICLNYVLRYHRGN